MVQARGSARRSGRLGADREQPEVVVVVRSLRSQERRPAWNLGAQLEAQRTSVEVNACSKIAYVEDGMIQAAYSH